MSHIELDHPALGQAPPLPSEVASIVDAGAESRSELLDRVYTLEHDVVVGPGRHIHVVETFTPRAFMKAPKRAALMFPGPVVSSSFCNIDVEGYHCGRILAAKGLFAYAVDFEGTGKSSYPEDGRSPALRRQVQAMGQVLRYIRALRGIPAIDILGESWGGGVAVELAADAERVRTCTLASMVYRNPSEAMNATFRAPGWKAMLDSLPDGYFTSQPEMYGGLVVNSPEAVNQWALTTQPGRYTSVPLYEVFELPFYDPSLARAPGLIIQGELDPLNTVPDVKDLAAAYGQQGANLVLVPEGGHVPRTDIRHREIFWSTWLEFLKS